MTLPDSADGWTLDLLHTLCASGRGETDQYDFKLRLSDRPDRVTKLVCAFANTRGGFVVFGVKQEGEKFLVEGLPANAELSKQIHDKVQADPSITLVAPHPILLGNERYVYVLHVPKSLRRPHHDRSNADRPIFWTRDMGRCRTMTHAEIRSAFVEHQEQRDRLGLLVVELEWARQACEAYQAQPDDRWLVPGLKSERLESLTIALFPVLKTERDLVRTLLVLSHSIRSGDILATRSAIETALPRAPGVARALLLDNNKQVRAAAGTIATLSAYAMKRLRESFEFDDPIAGHEIPIVPLSLFSNPPSTTQT